jgi:hypothetical protein
MKKNLALLALSGLLLFSCKKEDVKTTEKVVTPNEIPANSNGYNVSTSANIDLIKKCADAWVNGDFEEYEKYYATNAIIHDNKIGSTVSENVAANKEFQKNNIKPTVEYNVIWEAVNYKADEKGIKNFVLSAQTVTWKKDSKTSKVISFQIVAVKDGKITEEWNIYDSVPFTEFIKN